MRTARRSSSRATARCNSPCRSCSGAVAGAGMGCRLWERSDCPQRAAPPLGRPLRIDRNSTTLVPCPVARSPE
ncbi:short-chain fatty acyl-CoA regulator family protein [Streptomyces sp. NPDC005251]|uniref:short-chain fatty acyl-CoA regulator family protein n=1 Tax=Streptomyces sp. NPDC005251 TaxID=3157166 RepID=UPI0033BF626B